MKKIKIAILDDHQIVIEGLKLLLASSQHLEIVYEHTSGEQMLHYLQNNEVDILLTDLMMPIMDGYEVAKQLRKAKPDIKIIALSMNSEGDLAHKLIHEIGIEGYVLKISDKQVLLQAIETVYGGQTFYAPELAPEIRAYRKILKDNEQIHLTTRELEIVKCIAQDMSNKQIADTLFISERTVETHRKNIFRKTDTHSAISLVEFAKQRKLIP